VERKSSVESSCTINFVRGLLREAEGAFFGGEGAGREIQRHKKKWMQRKKGCRSSSLA
jgi:hypothetical protein